MLTGLNYTNTNWKMKTSVIQGLRPAIPGISASDLAEFMGFGSFITAGETAMLESIVSTSVEMIVAFTGYEPSNVSYKFLYDRHPMSIQTGGIAGKVEYSDWIQLPRRPVISVDSVIISGETLLSADYDVDVLTNPARVGLKSYSISYEFPGFSQIEIEASCGPGLNLDSRFVMACLMLSSYMYNNRGCDVSGALSKSGARDIVRPLKVATGGL